MPGNLTQSRRTSVREPDVSTENPRRSSLSLTAPGSAVLTHVVWGRSGRLRCVDGAPAEMQHARATDPPRAGRLNGSRPSHLKKPRTLVKRSMRFNRLGRARAACGSAVISELLHERPPGWRSGS
jgi:hypothetical protein